MLFLKYLDDLEDDRKQKAELAGKPYSNIIEGQYRWGKWAAPKKKDGTFDHDHALTGDDLIEFVDKKLFPYRRRTSGPTTVGSRKRGNRLARRIKYFELEAADYLARLLIVGDHHAVGRTPDRPGRVSDAPGAVNASSKPDNRSLRHPHGRWCLVRPRMSHPFQFLD